MSNSSKICTCRLITVSDQGTDWLTYDRSCPKPLTWNQTPVLTSSFKVSKHYPIAGGSMASKYIINVRDFSPHKIIARGSLAGKYIINTRIFNPHKIIAGVSLAGKYIRNTRVLISP